LLRALHSVRVALGRPRENLVWSFDEQLEQGTLLPNKQRSTAKSLRFQLSDAASLARPSVGESGVYQTFVELRLQVLAAARSTHTP
jgi:hypothetical protein